QVAREERADVGGALQAAAQVAVGDDADQVAGRVHDGGDAEALVADLGHAVRERRILLHARQRVAPPHQVLDPQQPAAQRPARREQGEVVRREAALLEQRDRQRVAQGHRRRGAGGGRETERTGLLGHVRVERDVRRPPEGRRRRTGERDERDVETLREGEQTQDLPRLTAVRRRDQDVPGGQHTEVAVVALAGVQEQG